MKPESGLAARYDIVVVGAGPAGMAAALAALDSGVERVLMVDREAEPGGILNQCIHNGFGLHHFGEELTGPEYAQRFLTDLLDHNIDIATNCYVLDISPDRMVSLMSPDFGVRHIEAGAVVLAMGARERTRGAIRIPGSRPAGVMTAGLAQKFVNQLGQLPGKKVVILGSGDIGLIMARRLTLEGIEVPGVFEILPHANGLSRNLVQCLHDFDIPLHLSTTVVEIQGRDRVESVTVAPVDDQRRPDLSRIRTIACDTLLVSIGLIPENELSNKLGLLIDPTTSGPVVSSTMETSRPGVFAAGNVVHIHDLVDFVSQESTIAGQNAARFVTGQRPPADNVKLNAGINVASIVPHTISTDREHTVYLRVREPLEKSWLRLGDVYQKRLRYVVPAETVSLKVRTRFLEHFHGEALTIDIVPRDDVERDER